MGPEPRRKAETERLGFPEAGSRPTQRTALRPTAPPAPVPKDGRTGQRDAGPKGHEGSFQVLGNKVFPETRALGRRLVLGSKDRTGLPQEKLCARLARNPGFCVDRVTLRCQGRTRPCRACFRSLSEDPGLNRELAPEARHSVAAQCEPSGKRDCGSSFSRGLPWRWPWLSTRESGQTSHVGNSARAAALSHKVATGQTSLMRGQLL